MCFRDMTFCPLFYTDCKKAEQCTRSLTEKVREDAEKWWGGTGAPIAQFLNQPSCHEKKDGS
jgi:hypothetical protein